jgi:hypothetical protein
MTEKPKALFVFVAECTMSDKKAGAEFVRVTQEEYEQGDKDAAARRTCIFGKNAVGVGQPGNVYEFDIEEKETGLSIYPGTKRYVGQWPNKEQRLEWQAKHRAFVNHREAQALEKKEASQSLLDECLGPMREQYRKLPHPRKQAFLAAVLYYITR